MSYIPGHETDEDEGSYHTEDEVMAWSPAQVAEYLEDQGVERAHCDVFREQEISGEVLLAMDQSSLFIKEFELGPVGRRLKTWHKVKALQDEVRRRTSQDARRSVASNDYSVAGALPDDQVSTVSDSARTRSSTMGTPSIFPRGLDPSSRLSVDGPGRSNTLQPSSFMSQQATPSPTVARSSSSAMSPLQSMTSMSRPENTYRPSAHSIRTMQQARRHSSIDSTSSAGGIRATGHRKQPSIDKKWQPGQAMAQAMNGQTSASHSHTLSAESKLGDSDRDPNVATPSSPGELDRGYFSDNNQTSSRTNKGNVLAKKTSSSSAVVSPVQSRANSLLFGNRYSAQQTPSSNNLREPVSPIVGTGAPSNHMFRAMDAVQNKFGSMRAATSPQLGASKPSAEIQSPANPIVTKLDPGNRPSLNALAATPNTTAGASDASSTATPSPSSTSMSFFATQKQKLTGLRAASEAVTKNEKQTAADVPPTVKEGEPIQSPTRTGSTTPSTDTRSFDLQKSMDGESSRTSTASKGQQTLVPPPVAQRRMTSSRPKAKKATSAYTRGLEKISPQEQLKRSCDYSGWMKKKSGSLMSTWKPRLFILKGRRLSYYYKDDDTEEKGLIDISFHRVLPAHHETLTGLHAAVTGAAGSPTSPTNGSIPTAAQKDLEENPPKAGEDGDGLFIFKLVPPKSGLAKGVTFTKPTVHYFAVNSRQEGRLWMAALMKATIDRDEDGVVTTTYNQKTISLAKARARKERPPALKEEEMEGRAELDGGSDTGDATSVQQSGLGIEGLSEKAPAGAGAEKKEEEEFHTDVSSLLPPTTNGDTEPRISDEKEVAPGAM